MPSQLDPSILQKMGVLSVTTFNPYGEESRMFDLELHIQIVGTMSAALQALSQELDRDLARIDQRLSAPNANFEFLTDERVDILGMYSDQTRFVRNSTLVSLTSRLYQALRRMANAAQRFSPRTKGRYNDGRFGKSNEYRRLWNELEERFGLDMVANSALIDFVEPMVMARNHIVHEGSQVNVLREDMSVDTTFSDNYPEYVCGTGLFVEVEASGEVLERNFEAATKLVKWVAEQLRAKELDHFKAHP